MKRDLVKQIYAWLSLTVVVFIVIGLSFGAGTFHPNPYKLNDLRDSFHDEQVKKIAFLDIKEPEFEFTDKQSFIKAVEGCVDFINYTTDRRSRIPTSIIIAMAGIESAWGKSRFAVEGNNLFGIRTWDLDNVPHMKAKGNPDANWGVKKYKTKCKCVQDMVNILNNHPAYEEFRVERDSQIDDGKWNYPNLLALITAWSTTPEYGQIIHKTIVDNKLP